MSTLPRRRPTRVLTFTAPDEPPAAGNVVGPPSDAAPSKTTSPTSPSPRPSPSTGSNPVEDLMDTLF